MKSVLIKVMDPWVISKKSCAKVRAMNFSFPQSTGHNSYNTSHVYSTLCIENLRALGNHYIIKLHNTPVK